MCWTLNLSRKKSFFFIIFFLGFFLFITGCASLPDRPSDFASPATAGLTVSSHAFNTSTPCTNTFIAHDLDHVTLVASDPVTMFDATGAGVAVNDLDNDGDIDIVLANVDGPNAIFWNQGGWDFTKEALSHGNSRGVTTVDVGGDGWLDIIFTTPPGSVSFWHNLADDSSGSYFEKRTLTGVHEPAYSMNWADFDADGDLDLVTGSYDAALEKSLGNSFMLSNGAGVFVYENQTRANQPQETQLLYFGAERLSNDANALALLTTDLNQDGQIDLLIGNDFVAYDQAWLQTENGWVLSDFFAQTTHSTMSFDVGDIDNDGRVELFATDMLPYADDAETQSAWGPMLAMMRTERVPGDPQVMANVLQMRTPANNDGANSFENRASELGVDATGWSWSAKFGDLDNDGFLDLYIANGMRAVELFAHLPNNELVEENQALRNIDGKRFEPAPNWNLNSTRGGRGMSMADFDGDGDLDIVINNLLAPAQLFENQLCGGKALAVDLAWPASGNTHSIGAQLVLQTDHGRYARSIQASSGYLSGDTSRIHFGLPSDATIEQLEISWPDGMQSVVRNIASNHLVRITRE